MQRRPTRSSPAGRRRFPGNGRHAVAGHLGWYDVTLCTDTLAGSLGGGSFVVKVDVNRNRISAEENFQNSATTVFTTSSISRI